MEKKTETKNQTKRRIFSAQEKTRAILEVWTNARKPVEVAREMDIAGSLLDLWQQKAMKAILEAMEPRQGDPDSVGTPLPSRVEGLLVKQARTPVESRLVERLGQVQATGSAVKKAAAKAKK